MIEARYRLDIFMEVLTILSLVFWSVFANVAEIRYIAVAFVLLAVGTDLLEEMRQLSYHRAKNESYFSNILSSTGASVFRWFRIFSSIVLIAMVAEMEYRASQQFVDFTSESYKIVISIVVLTRWFRLVSYLYGYAAIGPAMLPIVKCTSNL